MHDGETLMCLISFPLTGFLTSKKHVRKLQRDDFELQVSNSDRSPASIHVFQCQHIPKSYRCAAVDFSARRRHIFVVLSPRQSVRSTQT